MVEKWKTHCTEMGANGLAEKTQMLQILSAHAQKFWNKKKKGFIGCP